MANYKLITTTTRGVYFGNVIEDREDTVVVENCRHVYSWTASEGKDKGTYSLATIGPQEGSRVGPPVSIKIRNVANLVDVTEEAIKAFEKATWE